MTLFLAAAAAHEPTILEQFGWTPWGFLCQIISFGIVAFLLFKFAYGPILSVLEERKRLIAAGLENSRNAEVAIAEARKAADEILAKTHADSLKIIEEARAAAKVVAEKESQRAIAQAGEIVQKAREAGEAEQKRLMSELKKELSRLVVETTAKVTSKVLTAADQKKIAQEAEQELAA